MSQRFNQWLGMAQGEDPGELILDTRPEHEVMPGTIHFAVLTTLAEVAASQVAGSAVVPSQISVHLVRRATPGRLEARGILIKQGRRQTVCDGEVTQNGKLVARVTVLFAVL